MALITFEPLAASHFPLLLKWLETPHVKAWWDQDVHWTPVLIREKYESCVEGVWFEEGQPKKIRGFIIHYEELPIGYIQLYNPYDFSRATPFTDLPPTLVAFDMYIGESDYLGKNIGSKVLDLFLNTHLSNNYTHVFVDPKTANIAAIKSYERAGFKRIKDYPESGETWMIRNQA